MILLQNNVLWGNKLNCFKAMQVLGGPTQILIWGSEKDKSPTCKTYNNLSIKVEN